MIQQIMIYAIAVAAVLGVAGMALERLAALQGWPRRTAWIVVVLLSVLLPLVMIQRAEPARNPVAVLLPAAQPERFATKIPTPRGAGSLSITPQLVTPQPAPQASVPQPVQPRKWHLPQLSDRTLLQAWAVASFLSILYLLGAKLRLAMQISGAQRSTLLGQAVLVSESTGPALMGVLRPRMVVPRWLLHESSTTQALILEHERQHIAGRDPLLIRAGVVLLAALPWNLPLWWQWRRMRQAIELDCDARVLRCGAEPQSYGEVLLAITRRVARMPSGVLAMSEPVSALERRIQNLLPDPTRHAALQAIASIAVVILTMGVAVAMNAPAIPMRATDATLTEVTVQHTSAPIAMPPSAPTPQSTLLAGAASAAVVPVNPGAASAQPSPAAPATGAQDAVGMSLRDLALRAAAQKYPELVNGRVLPGYYYVTIVVRADGTVFRSTLTAPVQSMLPVPPTTLGRTFDRVSEGPQTAKIAKGQQIADAGVASNDIAALWRVLPADYDESRDARRVIDVVRAKHDDLMLTSGAPLGTPMRNINLLTVFMTEDSQIALQAVEVLDNAQYQSLNPRPVNGEAIIDAGGGPYTSYNPPSVPPEAFKVLGLEAEEIGKTGLLLVGRERISFERLQSMPRGVQREMFLPHYLLVRYAWPRRPGEPIGGKGTVMAAPTAQHTQYVPSPAPPLRQPPAPSRPDFAAPFDPGEYLSSGGNSQQRIKEQLSSQYADLARDLALAPADADRFLGLIAAQQARGIAATTEASRQGVAPQDIQHVVSERLLVEEREQAAMLGSKYPQWTLYEGRVAARFVVGDLRTLLGTGDNALTDVQAASLEAAIGAQLAQIRRDLKDNKLPPTASATPSSSEFGLRNMMERNKRVLGVASSYLTAVQFARFREKLEEELSSLRNRAVN